jgi:hypothetical protein
MDRVHNVWTGCTVDQTRAHGGCSPECGRPGATTRRGGAVLVLIGEWEATETDGDEREQEAVVVIGVERLRARR